MNQYVGMLQQFSERMIFIERVSPFNAVVSLLIENIGTQNLRKLFRKASARSTYLLNEDADKEILKYYLSQSFPIYLIDIILNHHNDENWINENRPEDMTIDEFNAFIFFSDRILEKWSARRIKEEKVFNAAVGIASNFAFILKSFVIASILKGIVYSNFETVDVIGFIFAITIFLCAIVRI